jgi:hypothetical protein
VLVDVEDGLLLEGSVVVVDVLVGELEGVFNDVWLDSVVGI